MTSDTAPAAPPTATPAASLADRLLSPAVTFALLLAAALVLRAATFGDPNLNGDENFYHTVGIAMHDGLLPYVDIWDRKPFGLFALYYLIAALGYATIVYQLAATLFAAATAWIIGALARGAVDRLGALLAGLLYLLWLNPLEGYGGQSPVLYNFFVAAAALGVLRSLPELRAGRVPRRMALAMVLGGLAVTMKTTAFFEAVFLGLYAGAVLLRAGGRARLRSVALWALLGALPTLLIAAGYAVGGHWHEYWHAMVTANFNKPPTPSISLANAGTVAVVLGPVVLCAAAGLWLCASERRFLLGWIGAALIGFLSVPNFFLHYALPLLVPLCVAAAGLLAREVIGAGLVVVLAILSTAYSPPFRPGHAAASRAAMAQLETAIAGHLGKGPLFVYHGPPQLYWRTGQHPPTPLVFPTHLSQDIERDTSHLSTRREIERVLALRPGVVVMSLKIEPGAPNEETLTLVRAYVHNHCQVITIAKVPTWNGLSKIAVWGDCRGAGAR